MKDTNRWKEHNQVVAAKNLLPAQTLQQGIALLENRQQGDGNFCIDLGCGSGIDTLALLEKNWQVLAIDKESTVITALQAKVPGELAPFLSTLTASFEEVHLPACDLVNASFSLPYCSPSHFNELWQKIVTALKPGAIFAGHFFGPRDSWANQSDMTFHSMEEISLLLNNFTIHYSEETEKDGKTISGSAKHWHVFHIAATKHNN